MKGLSKVIIVSSVASVFAMQAHGADFKLPNVSYEAHKFELISAMPCTDNPNTPINESLSCPDSRLLADDSLTKSLDLSQNGRRVLLSTSMKIR